MILNLLGLIALVAIGFKFLRSIVGLLWFVALFIGLLLLVDNGTASVKIPSYEELKNYPMSCQEADNQLKYLKDVRSALKLPEDPDQLNENDRIYNSRLKATIWWYSYTCGKS